MDISRRLVSLTTSNTMDKWLQITEYMKRGITEMQDIGKMAIHKDTLWGCTIEKVQVTEAGVRYTVHFDHQPKKLLQVVWGDGLVILGGKL